MNGAPHDYTRLSAADQGALEEVLAAYALGALGEAEAAAVAGHVARCPACRARAAGLGTTVGLLPAACEEVEPSPELRARLRAAVQAVGGATTMVTPAPPAVAPDPTAMPAPPAASPDSTAAPAGPPAPPTVWRGAPARPPRAAAPWRWALPVAALLLVSVGLGLWSVQLQRELAQQQQALGLYQNARQTWHLDGAGQAARATGMLVERAAGPPVLLTRDLPALPPSLAYQGWVIRDGQPLSACVFPAGAGGELLSELSQAVAGASTVAVTVEPAGGSPGPTGPIVLATNL